MTKDTVAEIKNNPKTAASATIDRGNRGDRRVRSGSFGKKESTPSEYEEKVVQVDRVSRTVKGGKRMRFRALVVIGNRKGKVGIGIGKAQEVLIAVQKAVSHAKKELIEVPIVNDTIPHEIKVSSGGATVFLKPAGVGTSIIAGGSVRAVIELSGIKNILSKIIGSSNKINNVKATILALKLLKESQARLMSLGKINPKKEVSNENSPTIKK